MPDLMPTMRHTVILPEGSTTPGYPAYVGGPFEDSAVILVSSLYGVRAPIYTPAGMTGDFHYGLDQHCLAPIQPTLLGLSDGEVIFSVAGDAQVGNWVRVKNGEWSWEYYHLAEPSPLLVGQYVKAGDYVGQVGTTGLSTGPHLHLGITYRGMFVDPLEILSGDTMTLNNLTGQFFSSPVWSVGGESLVVFTGGTVYQLHEAAKAVGASGVWVQDWQGAFQLLIVDGPDFLKDDFTRHFPRGVTAPTSVHLVKNL